MWHRMSVQENMHGHDKDGGIKRVSFPFLYKDIRCHIQGNTKEDIVLQYNIKSIEHCYVIYYIDKQPSYAFNERMRFLTNVDFRIPLATRISMENTRIFEFKGANPPVTMRQSRLHIFELYVEENLRWEL